MADQEVIDCVFCQRVERGEYDDSDDHAVVFAPLNPVTPGHLLIVPRIHVPDAAALPRVYRDTCTLAATVAAECGEDFNLITSGGAAATQTIRHLHIHYVPRRPGDGLCLPWTKHDDDEINLTHAAGLKWLDEWGDDEDYE